MWHSCHTHKAWQPEWSSLSALRPHPQLPLWSVMGLLRSASSILITDKTHLMGYDSPWKGEEEQFLSEPTYPLKPPQPFIPTPSVHLSNQSLACQFCPVSPPPSSWCGRVCVHVCMQGRERTEMKRQSNSAMRDAVCSLSERKPQHAQRLGPAQGMEAQLVLLLRSLEVNTKRCCRCFELANASRRLIFSAEAEWSGIRKVWWSPNFCCHFFAQLVRLQIGSDWLC